MASVDNGWSALNNALSSPSDYFESSFNAASGTPYHVWLRLRAGSNSKWNDSVWVQFSDAVDQNGSPVYRIGTSSGLLVNLEPCNNCGVGNWGWQDSAYWLSQLTSVAFASSGSHTIRVQTREDGVQIDQLVLSPSTYLNNAPGRDSGDTTILSEAVVAVSFHRLRLRLRLEGYRRFTDRPRRFPAESRLKTSTTAERAWPITTAIAATTAGRIVRRTSTSRRPPGVVTTSAGSCLASGSTTP
jgi:hypothetical protein